jgi:hypothetical protein
MKYSLELINNKILEKIPLDKEYQGYFKNLHKNFELTES